MPRSPKKAGEYAKSNASNNVCIMQIFLAENNKIFIDSRKNVI
jgi:hypothetical protein